MCLPDLLLVAMDSSDSLRWSWEVIRLLVFRVELIMLDKLGLLDPDTGLLRCISL